MNSAQRLDLYTTLYRQKYIIQNKLVKKNYFPLINFIKNKTVSKSL